MAERSLTVGVLTPHASPGAEIEFPVMTSGRVATVVSRVEPPDSGSAARTGQPSLQDLRRVSLQPVLDQAAAAFPSGSVDALAYASTSAGYALGFEAEVALLQRLQERWALPVSSSCASAVHALHACGIERLAVVHPPWFDDETHELGAAYFRTQGFDVVASKADSLPRDPARARPELVVDWVSRHLSDDAEAVFLGGNGLRAASAVEPLERRTGRPVLEANQVLLWSILAATQAGLDIGAYGRLLRERRSPARPAVDT